MKRHHGFPVAIAYAFALAGCPNPVIPRDAADVATDAVDAVDDLAPDAPAVANPDCDPLVTEACTLPWPSNLYLAPDSTRRTGYTLTFGPRSLPQSIYRQYVEPEPYRRMDGYGLGVPIMVVFPNLDASQLPDENAIERSLAADASVMLFEVAGTTLRRVPYFCELDSHETNPARRILFVRPAVILKEATRYVVAFRNLRDVTGAPIRPSAAFAALRDNQSAGMPAIAPRQPRFDAMFSLLDGHGVMRDTLTLAWDFNTASSEALHGRMLAMRDDALSAPGERGPALTVVQVREFVASDDGSGREVNAHIALELRGTFQVPSYLRERALAIGTEFNLENGRVARNGTRNPVFWIRIPRTALDGTPHGLLQYGHGLLGQGDQVRSGFLDKLASDHHLILFAASLTGMTADDFGALINTLRNLSAFVSLADGLHQGITEWVLLARAVRERLMELPEVASRNIVVNRSEMFYSGNSQGGIFGATYLAVSPDIRYGHLGVPGNNYSTLLHRSVDFDRFFNALRVSYPDPADQAVGVAAVQLLWDGSDPVSYLRHITAEPFPGNTPHAVMLIPAKGDHQVSVMTDEIAARSDIGIRTMAYYDNQRMPFGLTPQSYPFAGGSALVLYDFGNPWPSPGNHTPTDSLPDPHELPRAADWHNQQIVHFFRTGEVIDVCGGDGCRPM